MIYRIRSSVKTQISIWHHSMIYGLIPETIKFISLFISTDVKTDTMKL